MGKNLFNDNIIGQMANFACIKIIAVSNAIFPDQTPILRRNFIIIIIKREKKEGWG